MRLEFSIPYFYLGLLGAAWPCAGIVTLLWGTRGGIGDMTLGCVCVCLSCRGPSFVMLLFSTPTLYFPVIQETWLSLVFVVFSLPVGLLLGLL